MIEKKFEGKIPLPYLLIITFTLAIIAFSYILINGDNSDVTTSILSGLLVGTVFSLIQFLIDFDKHLVTNRLRKLELKEVLTNRSDTTYYNKLLVNARCEVNVMGSSCSRFIEDFMDIDSDSHVLLNAMKNNTRLKVKLLIPTENNMLMKSRISFIRVEPIIKSLIKDFPNQFELRRFNDAARHSFVIVDDDLIAGPIFQDIDSKNSPAIHISSTSVYGRKHVDYYDNVWNKSC